MLTTRSFLAGCCALALTAGLPGTPAKAQIKARNITIIVPFSPGTGVDILARVIGEELQGMTGQPVVVENKPGASGNIGTYEVARAEPDGNTLLLTAPSHVLSNLGEFKKFNFDPVKSFAPIVEVATGDLALVVHPSVKADNLQDFLKLAKAQPGTLNYASTGPLSAQHLAMELFKVASKTDIVHVPYPGSAGAIRDVVAGHVQAMFMPLHTALPLISNKQIKALAISSPKRSSLAPEIPTNTDAGLTGADVGLWYGLLAPAGTPKEIVDRYNTQVNQILTTAKVKEALAKQGLVVVGGTPQQFQDFLVKEVQLWEKVLLEAGIKPEK
jgi:tripartite-type tricarboxylate transporter receptor subunit TctC